MDLTPAETTLLIAAFSVAGIHTLIGVDHYLPFVVLGRARQWSLRKVLGMTMACGLGHVVGSILLGLIGIGIGVAVGELEWIESVRGTLAAWGLIAFGLAYMGWALVRLRRGEHAHVHGPTSFTFWGLFVVFALGPCEPLIPVLMVPAFEHDWSMVIAVAAVFSLTTIATMTGAAMLGSLGLRLAPLGTLERYANLAAGAAITSSGAAIALIGI